ncbi:hypothetical protein [Streptomyces thermolilacinus]|uniref:hypothetical protein n=1 Tax=Streptomyces thermolilacinus TaxID=285540 RepID=UPI0033F599D4
MADQNREPARAADSRAQDALDYARAAEHRAWQTHRDQIHHGADTVPANYGR